MKNFLALVMCVVALPAGAALSIQVSAKAITVSGATAGASVMLIGYGRYVQNGMEYRADYAQAIAVDSSGAGHFDVPREFLQSVWMAVDMQSGHSATGLQVGYDFAQISPPLTVLSPGRDTLFLDMQSAIVWVVRPSAGAWRGVVARGRPSDENPANANVRAISIRHFSAIGTAPAAPQVLLPGDVILALSPPFMQFWTMQVQAGKANSEAENAQ